MEEDSSVISDDTTQKIIDSLKMKVSEMQATPQNPISPSAVSPAMQQDTSSSPPRE